MSYQEVKIRNVQWEAKQVGSKLTELQTANECLLEAANEPELLQLFGKIWHQGELAILFADTGIGKSLLAVTIADAIANGKNCCGQLNQTLAQPIIYYDFELSNRMFHNRYHNGLTKELYQFGQGFLRGTLNAESFDSVKDFDKLLFESFSEDILATGSTIIIVDNITALTMKTNTDADAALILMKQLNGLKAKYNLSILVLAHTTKIPSSLPIHINHMGGSKHLANFADSVFAFGKSFQDEQTRYLKQIKARNSELVFGHKNVLVLQKVKNGSFLGFEFLGYASEDDHIFPNDDRQEQDRKKQTVIALTEQGKTQREVAEITNLSASSVNRILKEAKP